MKKTLVYLLGLVCLSLLASPVFAQKYLRKAEKAFELGHFEESIPGFEKYLRKNPTSTATNERYAFALRMMTRLPEALQVYEVLAKAKTENPNYAYGHAVTLFEMGRYGEAVEKLSVAAQLGHPAVEALAARLQFAQANGEAKSSWRVSNEFANVAGDDYAAAVIGDFVVYSSTRDQNGHRLYRTTRDDNSFIRIPQLLHRQLSEQVNDAPIAYSPSGELVAFTRNNFQTGERFLPAAGWELNLQLSTTTEQDDFSEGKAFVHNGPGYSTGFPAFSKDGNRLYFSSDRPGGQGGFDIYYAERTDSGWGPPVNLGEKVNTPGNEIAPATTSGSLYFASDQLPGYGGMDVYRADLLSGEVTNVVNMGIGVNSPLDDVGFAVTEDDQIAYFFSNRSGGKGGLDLYRALRSGKALTIAVLDGKTGKPIPNALLDFSNCGQGNFLTGIDGEYTFRAVEAMNCRPLLRKSGYNAKEFSLNAKALRDNQRLEIKLNPEDKISIYEGKVLHSRTGDVLADVAITAKQIDGEYSTSATSDENGYYELSLERGAAYVISYARSGMADIDREVSTYDRDGGNILSSFAMFPAASAPALATTNSSVGTAPAELELPSANSSEKKFETRRVAGEVQSGFAVQVAALSENATDITEYQNKLGHLAPVYGKREAGVLRVRLGPFEVRKDAYNKLAMVKAAGFSDAFIAKESGGVVVGQDRTVEVPVSGVLEPGNVAGQIGQASPTIPSAAAQGNYLIRLATYGNFKNFDTASVANLGTLTTRTRGDYVVVLVQGFASVAAAQAKLAAAKQAGFNDAHVVVEEPDGTLRKVK